MPEVERIGRGQKRFYWFWLNEYKVNKNKDDVKKNRENLFSMLWGDGDGTGWGKASKRKTKKTGLTPSGKAVHINGELTPLKEAVLINGELTPLKEVTSDDSVKRNAGYNMLLPGFSKRSGFSFCPRSRG